MLSLILSVVCMSNGLLAARPIAESCRREKRKLTDDMPPRWLFGRAAVSELEDVFAGLELMPVRMNERNDAKVVSRNWPCPPARPSSGSASSTPTAGAGWGRRSGRPASRDSRRPNFAGPPRPLRRHRPEGCAVHAGANRPRLRAGRRRGFCPVRQRQPVRVAGPSAPLPTGSLFPLNGGTLSPGPGVWNGAAAKAGPAPRSHWAFRAACDWRGETVFANSTAAHKKWRSSGGRPFDSGAGGPRTAARTDPAVWAS